MAADPSRGTGRLWTWLKTLGPGIVTGASDDDPSGIATYAQIGAAFGYGMLWTALFTLPLMAAAQMTCARIAQVTHRGLASVIHRHYSPWLVWPAVMALVIANTINVGADLGAVAAGAHLITGWPQSWFLLPTAGLIVMLQVFGRYAAIANVLKWLTLTLFAYVATAFLVEVEWWAVLRATVLPHVAFTGATMTSLVAIFGTTISPYLFFWQASMEVEEERQDGGRPSASKPKGTSPDRLQRAQVDVGIGMTYSNLVMFFIILTTGATLHPAGTRSIQTAQQAAMALRPLAGDGAFWLFAAGLISTGMLAIPVLAGSSAYAVAEICGWRLGLDRSFKEARPFYGVLIAGILVGLGLNVLDVNPIKALFWAAVINGVAAPPLLVLIMRVARDPRVMGQQPNPPVIQWLGWLVTGVMSVLAIAMVVTAI